MRKVFLLLLFTILCANFSVIAQTIYTEIASSILTESRKLKIQLPRNYETNTDKKYPIVLTLDGDYLFEPVAGNVDYFSYWEDMPEAIVVGIMQDKSRFDDTFYDETNYLPAEKGADFFEFIGLELIPFLDKEYRTAKFIVAVGHDFTANFINYYLFKSPPLFNGYIVLSPDLDPKMNERLTEKLSTTEYKTFYYLATGTNDIKSLHKSAKELNVSLKTVDNKKVKYYFDDFEGATHYSLVARGIPNALENIFSVYRPISKQEFNDVLMKLETPVSEYLIEKYKTIEDLFGLQNPIRTNDFIATATASEKKEEWKSLEEIAKMAKKQYPNTLLGDYYLGRFYEETGDPKKAFKTYQGAYNKTEVDFITVDLMMEKAERLKADFGY